MGDSENKCPFCPNQLNEAECSKLYSKGCDTINRIIRLSEIDMPEVCVGQLVHTKCRNNFTRNTGADSADVNSTDIRVNNDCFFCGWPVKGKHARTVKSVQFIENVNERIAKRSDEWSNQVENRIQSKELMDASYHNNCSVNFQNNKNIPLCYGGIAKKAGRPQNEPRIEALSKLIEMMESEKGRIFSISEVVKIMERECEEEAGQIENRYVKKKLVEHFGVNLIVISNEGKPDLMLLSETMNSLITELYEDQTNSMSKMDATISKVANKIKSELLLIPKNKGNYPSHNMLSDLKEQISFVPGSLHRFLSLIFAEADCELKVASIGQAIVLAARPRSIIAPLLFGLGVQMHHTFKSKFLIETLYKLGFSSSYPEVQQFRYCAASTVDDVCASMTQVVKFMADNIDHDTRTIDGKGTFHGMGMIAALTPGHQSDRSIVRRKATIADVKAIGQVDILPYLNKAVGNGLRYEKLSSVDYNDDFLHTELLLKITWSQRTARPMWSGIMQLINNGSHSGKSSIKILPMIDLSASDPTCIFSTLHFLCTEAEKYGVTPIITFDQPLWWKSTLIIQDEPVSSRLKKIVLLLGGFHMQMSFLGSIGHLMNGTGLQECLETVYAPNSVIHMLSGKAVQRAVRGHFLVNTALNDLMTRKAETILPEVNWESLLAESAYLYDQLISLEIASEDLHSNRLLKSLMQHFSEVKEKLSNHRTAKIWIQYMDMVDLLRDFIRSERTGNWKLHLATVRKMIPYFAAAGHSNYAKCAQIYLQQMESLEHNHPDVYSQFIQGNHVVRRSDRFWAGLSSDLTIEQTLMRAAKSRGGFTRGGGCSENQRMIWIQSMPACADINIAMQKITNLYYETSEQHKDCSESRQIRDEKDTKTILEFLADRDPFSADDSNLRNIYTGEEAHANVNVDDATSVGSKIVAKMVGKDVSAFSFENANKAVTMGTSNAILIDGKLTHIDPQLLFQRLMLMARNFSEEDLQNVFKFELCQKPPSLFDESGLMREAKTDDFVKQCFAENMAMNRTQLMADCESNSKHVLCGNSFLDRIPWKKNQTFREICSMYIDYAKAFNKPTVIFDCIPDGTTLDEFSFRRNKGIRGVNIKFNGNTVFNSKKEHFMANKSNRACFTTMLTDTLEEIGCTVLQAKFDQNVTLAETAAEIAFTDPVMVTTDDVEVILMLCHCFKDDGYDIICKYEESSKKPPVYYSIKNIRNKHEQQVIDNIYFLHAIGGSKTTSHMHSIGKSQSLKKISKSSEFRSVAHIFSSRTVSIPRIIDAGIKAITILYDGKLNESLDTLRFKQFSKKVSTKKSAVLVNSLSPTTEAAKHHVLRVYFQVQQLLGNRSLDPRKYGWKSVKSTSSDTWKLVPITTDMDPAPPELLSKIRCQCKGNCSTLKCGCLKNQVKCTSACTVCCGTDCLNIDLPVEINDEDENDLLMNTEIIESSGL